LLLLPELQSLKKSFGVVILSGIGLEAALLFVEEGACVALADIQPEAGEQALIKVLQHAQVTFI
jgi:NAD(P)-dependent dehydrogenase (short-subunit alcohol dehydrogenase family)